MSVVINGSAGVTVNSGAVLGITSGTAVASTSGTSIDFTSIPSWVKRITVMFNGVSLSGTDEFLIQVGTGSTPATAGYNSSATSVSVNTSNTTNGAGGTATNGFTLAGYSNTAGSLTYGQYVITKLSGNIWAGSGNVYSTGAARICTSTGCVDLSASALEMVRITSTGSDTFDAGSINILYE